jgi:hypothetical protein
MSACLRSNDLRADVLADPTIGIVGVIGMFRQQAIVFSQSTASVPGGCSLPSLVSVRLTRWASHAIPEFMRMVELRLLLALLLVLLGATVIVDLNLGDDADTMTLQSRTQPLRVNLDEKTQISVGRPSPPLDPSRTNSDIAPRTCVSVMDLACVLRC